MWAIFSCGLAESAYVHPPGLNYSPRRKVFRRGQKKIEKSLFPNDAISSSRKERSSSTHMVDKNHTTLFNHGIKMLATYRAYILNHRFGSRLYNLLGLDTEEDVQ